MHGRASAARALPSYCRGAQPLATSHQPGGEGNVAGTASRSYYHCALPAQYCVRWYYITTGSTSAYY